MDELIGPLLEVLDRDDPGDVVGVYLYGSAVSTGLRVDSDIDLLMLTRHSLSQYEREMLVSTLLPISGWHGHAKKFPDAADRRPIELTSMILDDEYGRSGWTGHDFQYGEWLREDVVAGSVPQPKTDPDIVILLATALTAYRALRGPALGEIVRAIPPEQLRSAVMSNVPEVLNGLDGDERNAVLTLARSVITLDTGRIVSKDEAADAVVPMLAAPDKTLLERAKEAYLGTRHDDWSELNSEVVSLAETLASMIAERYEKHQ